MSLEVVDLKAMCVGGARHIVWMAQPDGLPVSFGLLRAGLPRGAYAVEREREQGREARALVRRVDNIDGAGAWYHTGDALGRWRLSASQWGEVDGAPFDRGLVRQACATFNWAITPRMKWATRPFSDGRCLVLRGPRDRRLLVMSGAAHMLSECSGRALRGGVLA